MPAADSDYVSYWRPFSPASGHPVGLGSSGAARHARRVRIAASAYTPQMLSREWEETSAAAARAARAARACTYEALATQGHALTTADFTPHPGRGGGYPLPGHDRRPRRSS